MIYVVSALVFAWDKGSDVRLKTFASVDVEGGAVVEDHVDVKDPKTGTTLRRVYHIEGPLFFASCQAFVGLFDPDHDPEHVELHFRDSEICDFSGIEALNALAEKYHSRGKKLHLKNVVCPATLRQVKKAEGLFSQELTFNFEEGASEDALAFVTSANAAVFTTTSASIHGDAALSSPLPSSSISVFIASEVVHAAPRFALTTRRR